MSFATRRRCAWLRLARAEPVSPPIQPRPAFLAAPRWRSRAVPGRTARARGVAAVGTARPRGASVAAADEGGAAVVDAAASAGVTPRSRAAAVVAATAVATAAEAVALAP